MQGSPEQSSNDLGPDTSSVWELWPYGRRRCPWSTAHRSASRARPTWCSLLGAFEIWPLPAHPIRKASIWKSGRSTRADIYFFWVNFSHKQRGRLSKFSTRGFFLCEFLPVNRACQDLEVLSFDSGPNLIHVASHIASVVERCCRLQRCAERG